MDPQSIGGQEGLPAVGELAGEPAVIWRLSCWASLAPELSCVGLLVSPQVAGRAVGSLATLPGAGVSLQPRGHDCHVRHSKPTCLALGSPKTYIVFTLDSIFYICSELFDHQIDALTFIFFYFGHPSFTLF